MLSFIAIIIPTLTSLLLYFFWNRKVVLLEFLALFATSFIAVGIVKLVADNQNTSDTEFWNGTKNEVRYYEPWDEEVPCRHPIYCTRTYECNCDSKGENCSTCTEEYICGYEHAYDVDYHPEYWQLETSLGSYGISQTEYNRLVALYGNRSFVELHRDYHSIDGDMYSSVWKGELEKLEMVTQSRTYENRVQASKSVFNFPEVDSATKANYKLFEYPPIIGLQQRHVLGYIDNDAEHHMDIVNGLLGPRKQLAAFICVYRNTTITAADMQEAYWKGGNKNEFIVCIGIDNANNIQWCKCFSWSEVAEPKITIRNFIMDLKVLKLTEIADYMYKELDTKFKRKRFRDFNYLSIPVTSGQLQAAVIITVILNILIAIWSVYNEFEDTKEFIQDKFTLRPFFDKIKELISQFTQWCNNIWNMIFKIK
jgi:hypothetical protein